MSATITVSCEDCSWSLGRVKSTGLVLHLIIEHEEMHGHSVEARS